ncbi:cilia- and flagella-associated protein 74 [Hypomesus transpacificus]|uniref:cilia- and flagella-associated protein 74 n=1 Tax=Hypomesus transpacificus TaxID=137520 RepID=UPI001F0749CA|nr:cilia- and flagella-associated protein 74 [Hypomesus transpacificus]
MDARKSSSLISHISSEHQAPLNTWTDEETGDEGTGGETFQEDDPALLAEEDLFGEVDASIWEGSNGDLAVGVGNSGKKSYAETARMFKLRQNLDQLDSFHRQKEHNVLKAREELRICRQNIAELEGQRTAVEVEIDQQQKDADNSASVFRLRAQHRRLCQELQAEEDLEAHVTKTLREHELELLQVEVELGRFSLLREEVQEEEQAYQTLQAQRGAARLQMEDAAVLGMQRKTQRLKAKKEAMLKEEEDRCRRSKEQSQASRKKAAVFLKETIKSLHQKEVEEKQRSHDLVQKRMQAVLSLKSNIAATQERLRAQQRRAVAEAQRQEQEERQLKEALEAQGSNSTKHMYQQKKLQEFQRKKEEFEEKQKSNRMDIVAKLLLEEESLERKKRHQALMFLPPSVNKDKMRQTRSRKKILQSLDPQPAKTKEKTIRQESALSSSSSSSDQEDLRESVDLEEQSPRESLAQPEFTGLWDQTHQVDTERSTTFQSRAARQDMTLLPVGKPTAPPKKVTHGKEFKGPPFISKPEVVAFKNFEVGQTYRRKIILTNISYIINYCKLLGISQDLMDFITISFKPPGPMSPGMACEMQATFQPMINKDLEGEVQFMSAAGPFSVPIRCKIKKCDLAVDSCLIDFGAHVVGQNISRYITLNNRGALGTNFALVPVAYLNPAETQNLTQSPAQVQAQISSQAFSCSTQLPNDSSSSVSVCDGQGSTASRADGDHNSKRESGKPSVKSEQKQSEAGVAEAGLGGVPSEREGAHSLEASREEASSDTSDITIPEGREGHVGPFESVKLEIVFKPTIPGKAKLDFNFKFSELSCAPIPVEVRGMAVSVPVWVTQPSIDLKICMFDRLYQDTIVVQSRASTALRLTFEVCPALRNHMEILPKTGYIQAGASFNAQLKFIPRRSLSEDAKRFFDSQTSVLEVPLALNVADQVRPVPFTVHAVVTSSDLQFDQTEVDFGHCSIYESVKTSVRLTNLSLLPQEFGFLEIPKFIEVQPNEGFGTLLPLETLEIDLIFSAKKAEEYSFQLTCKSGIHRDFPILCRAVGVHPLLELSHSLVHFGATAIGDNSTAVLHVVNSHTSRNEFSHAVPRVGGGPVAPVGPRLFSFALPENSEIILTPTAGRVLPGQRCLVQVTFRPRLGEHEVREEAVRLLCRSEELRLQDMERHRGVEAEGGKRSEQEGPVTRPQGKQALKEKNSKVSISPKNDSPFQPPNPADIQPGSVEYAAGKASLVHSFSQRYSRYIIPCFVSEGDSPQGEPHTGPAYSPLNTLYLELLCPAVRPPLVVTLCNDQTTIDFKQVAVGQKVVKQITIQNISHESLDLSSSVLDLSGPFSLLNALRRLGPGGTHILVLAFTPALGKKYREVMEILTHRMTMELRLCGEGIVPVITCSHQESLINFGYVLEKESATYSFKLQNTSSLDVRFSVLLDSQALRRSDSLPALISPSPEGNTQPTVGTQNFSGLSVFSVTPIEGSIAPGNSRDITVTFLPDHESLHYSDRLRVQLINKHTVCAIELRGAARAHTMYLCGGDPLTVPIDALLPVPSSGNSELKADSESPPLPVLLTLRGGCKKGAMIPAVRELEVGCIRTLQPVAKKNVDFSWDSLPTLQQKGFSVEPSKGTVDAGNRRTITATWTPPSGLQPNEVVQVCVPLILRGDDTEVYNVTLLALASGAKD